MHVFKAVNIPISKITNFDIIHNHANFFRNSVAWIYKTADYSAIQVTRLHAKPFRQG